MICFYHSADLDGHLSGAIVKLKYPHCKLIPIEHGEKFPWKELNSAQKVFMVDFSLKPLTDMFKLNAMVELIWIDHHKSAMQEYLSTVAQYGPIAGVRENGRGACALVWKEMFRGKEPPEVVKKVADADVWNIKDDSTLPFYYGAMMFNTDPSKKDGLEFWKGLIFPKGKETPIITYDEILKVGQICMMYQERYDAEYCKKYCFETEFEGFKCLALNIGRKTARTFSSVLRPEHDIMMAFCHDGEKWHVSLYTEKDDIDLSEIARKYDGGGHRRAAGFICDELPF